MRATVQKHLQAVSGRAIQQAEMQKEVMNDDQGQQYGKRNSN
jgi:hypothetical protein